MMSKAEELQRPEPDLGGHPEPAALLAELVESITAALPTQRPKPELAGRSGESEDRA